MPKKTTAAFLGFNEFGKAWDVPAPESWDIVIYNVYKYGPTKQDCNELILFSLFVV